MMSLRSRRSPSAFVAVGLALLLAACSGNDVLGPPDGTACSVGTIAPGDSVKGAITGASCAGFSDYEYTSIWFASHTLHASQGMAYVVRLRHVQDDSANDNINADLFAYTRNTQGDAVFATGWWSSFGATNGNGGFNEEMYLVGDQDRDYSIRVQIYDPADTGAYTLSVVGCPIRALTIGTAVTGVDLGASTCTANAFFGNTTLHKMTFFGFQADSVHTYDVVDSVTAGAGTIQATASGPDADVGCYTDNCTYNETATGVTNFDLLVNIGYGGFHTVMVGVNADSAATISTVITGTALTAPHPATSTRRRPLGARSR